MLYFMGHSVKAIREFGEQFNVTERDLKDPFRRAIQRRFDAERFDRTYPAEEGGVAPRDAKIFHIGKHIGKALGEMNDYFDARSHRAIHQAEEVIATEVLPDALIYRTQLANELRFGLDALPLAVRYEGMDETYQLLGRARSLIDCLDERTDHRQLPPQVRSRIRTLAIPALHQAGLALAAQFEIDPPAAHLNRLITLNSQPGLL